MTRAARIGIGVAALAAVLFVVAGYWLAPRGVRDALIELAARHEVELRIEQVRANPFALALELQGIEATGASGQKLAAARLARADLAWSSLWGERWRVQSLVLEGPQLFLSPASEIRPSAAPDGKEPRFIVERLEVREGALDLTDAERSLRLAGIAITASGVSSEPGEAGEFELAARPVSGGMLSWRGRITLEPVALEGRLSAAALDLAAVMQLASPRIEPAPGQLGGEGELTYAEGRFAFKALALEAAQREGSGRAAAQGTMEFSPFAADLRVDAAGIDAAYVRRWLPPDFAPNLVSGVLSLDGKLSAERYEGALAISGFRLDERDSGRLLLAWERLSTEAATLEFSPFALDLDEVRVQAPQARLVIEAGGAVNVAEAFAGPAGRGSAAGGEAPPRVAVGRLHIEKGVLHFADRTLGTPFEATIRDLEGAVSGFGTAADDPAVVAISGRVGKYGSAELRGSINLGDPLEHADLRAQFRNIALAQLTPYVAKFAGYRVRSGRVSADLHYRVRAGELVGENELVLRELRLGEKVEREGLKSLPLDLLVALLADDEGRIDLAIPVSGSLNDPSFDFGGLLTRATGAAVGKIVAAPFRALARLFRGDGDGEAGELARMQFPAGAAGLPPPEAENVAKVAQALGERPQLGVAVHGGYDAERDAAALRLGAVRREILRRAGYAPEGPLDFSDAKIARAASVLYRERIGDPGGVDGKTLLDHLAREKTLEPGALQALARERAQAISRALAKHGVDPARVATAVREGAPTELELATLASPALSQDALVQAAQRRLKAAGFVAGPADGVLGSRTESALRAFQHRSELRITGELDAPTLHALGLPQAAAAGASR